jgi:hypothetical protein
MSKQRVGLTQPGELADANAMPGTDPSQRSKKGDDSGPKVESQRPALPRAAETNMEQRFASAMRENIDWLEAHKDELLRKHPDWADKYVAVASRTPSKILAISEDRSLALEEGLKSGELLEQAARDGLSSGCLINAMFLGTSWDF